MSADLLQLLEEHLERLRSLNSSPTTVRSRSYSVREFLRWLAAAHGVASAERLTSEHLRSWQVALARHRTSRGELLRPRAANKKIEGVRRFLDDLHGRGYLGAAALGALDYVKEPKLLPRALQHEQMRALLQGLETSRPEGYRDRTMLELLYSSGLRAAELLGLDVDGVDFGHQVVTVVGKGRKERVVPVGATALRYIEGYLRAVRPALVRDPACRALFLDTAGHRLPYHTLRRIVLRAGADAGLGEPLTAHMFRRSCTSELVRGNANLYHISRMLGHERLDTLRHYVRLNIADIQKTHRLTHPRERDEKSREEGDPQPQPQ
jgi:site-specific recombinase XerD